MRPVDLSQNSIMTFFRNGEEEGFNYFFNAYYKAVYFFACKYVKDSAAAEDIVENSFIKLWEKREQMESEAGLRGYLYKTVYHGCLRWNSRSSMVHSRQKEIVYLSETVEKDCLENIIKAETLRRVKEAMEELPSECRKVFMKLFVEGKSVVEAAAELNVAVSTVKNQKARGIKLLRMRLTSFLFVVFSLWFVVF
ncbi:MAG TPA: RNA polymerase sigma-70 factor [Chitinophagaceae bacterium]|nr:RNA polymerase sigma-70 factor [Chitinophagaceae bacterium]